MSATELVFSGCRLVDVLDAIDRAIGELDPKLAYTAGTNNASDTNRYVVLDRVEEWVHLGIVVSAPRTEDTGRASGRSQLWARDTVLVELRLDLARVSGQRAMRTVAAAHEEQIRECVLGLTQQFRPSYVDTVRGTGTDRRWHFVRMTFTVERLELVGPAA